MRIFQPNFTIKLLFFIFALGFLVACGGGGGSPDNSGTSGSPTSNSTDQSSDSSTANRSLQKIVISPFIDSIVKGGQVSFSSTGIYDDHSSEDLSSQVSWSVNDETIAQIDQNGQVLPLKAGVVSVIASFQGLGTQHQITVNEATLDAIQLIPQQSELSVGMQKDFKAIGYYSNGSSLDISQQVDWMSSHTDVLQMSSSVAHPTTPGSTLITASLNGVSAQATVTVNSATLQRIEISPLPGAMELALKHKLVAYAFYSNQSMHDISDQVDWMIDDPSIASLNNTSLLLEALSIGETMIRASLAGFNAQTSLQVVDARLTGIEVSPANSTLAVGLQQEFKATGVFSNHSSRDLTELVTWQSGNEDVLLIDNRSESRGVAKGISRGESLVTAYFNGRSGSTVSNVSDAVLSSIEVTPANSKLARGLHLQFEARALYSDGSHKNVTQQVSWSSESHHASLVPAPGQGVFQSNLKGSTRIIASLNGKQGYTNLQITDATLDSLIIVAQTDTQALGSTQSLLAYANYSDGSTQDVTDQVLWESSNSDIAQISHVGSGRGELRGMALGSVDISAHLEGVIIVREISITAASLQQIQLSTLTNPWYINQRRQIDALGIYSDNSQQNLNQQLLWSSSDIQLATVSNVASEAGLVTVLSAGQVVITATAANGISRSMTLDVIDQPNYPASVSVAASPNIILNNGIDSTQLTATIKPLQGHGVIADNTQINFIILENGVNRFETASTLNGVAEINLTSLNIGFIQVTAEIDNTDLNATSALFSTDNFAQALQIIPYARYALTNNDLSYARGSVFALFIRNLSNRDFNLLAFQMKNGNDYLPDMPITDSQLLSDGVLQGGEYTGIGYQLDNDTVNNTISAGYLLSDNASAQGFGFNIGFP